MFDEILGPTPSLRLCKYDLKTAYFGQHRSGSSTIVHTTKMIQKLRNISYEMRQKECGLTTLETRRLRGDQIEVFKILNGYENIDRNIYFTVKEERRTRGHGVTLAKKQCRLDIRKFSFSQRTVNEWNILSADCVGASSVNIFKNKIDIYLRRAGYT